MYLVSYLTPSIFVIKHDYFIIFVWKNYLNLRISYHHYLESIYKCIDAFVLPVTSIEDEYVVVVFEIMGDKLKRFYGGKYLI